MSQKRLRAYFYLLVASIIWGVAGPVVKYTLFSLPPLIFLTYRFAISTVLAIPLLFIRRPKLPSSAKLIWFIILISFLTSTVRLGLLFFGFEKTTSLSGNLLSALSPLAVVFAGALFLHERVTRLEKIGIAIAFIGTVISVVEPVLSAEHQVLTTTIQGNVLVLTSLIFDVIATILIKIALRKTIDPLSLTLIMFIVGFATIVPVTLYLTSPTNVIATIVHAPLSAHLGVWYMAFLSGLLAYTLDFKGLKTIEVGEASVFTYLSPIWGVPISLLLLNETVSGPFILGAIIIFVGVVIAEYKRTKRKPALRRR